MECVWELKQGEEVYGSMRGGLGKETVRFRFEIIKPGYYFFVAAMPYALNQKGSLTFERFKLQNTAFARRISSSASSRFSVDVAVTVSNKYQQLYKKGFVLDVVGTTESYQCFDIPASYAPVTVNVQLQGHAFIKKLKVLASCHRYGGVPRSREDSDRVGKIGNYLMAELMYAGNEDYDRLMSEERAKLMHETQDFNLFPAENLVAIAMREKALKNLKSDATFYKKRKGGDAQSSPEMFEIESTATIGDAMFYLIDKGVQSAPVWNENERRYLGLFDIQDAMHFTLKLRDVMRMRSGKNINDAMNVHGVDVYPAETSHWFGLDLPVEVFFREENRFLTKWHPLRVSSSIKEVLEALNTETQRIPIEDPMTGRIIRVISQSEVINQVFHRFIRSKTNELQRAWFEQTDLCEEAVERGIKVFTLSDKVIAPFREIMSKFEVDAVPVIDDDGELCASLTSTDAWFLCKIEMDENAPLDLNEVTVREFLDFANAFAEADFVRKRKGAVPVLSETPLKDVISKIVQHKVHGVYVVDETGVPLGRIRVSHIVEAIVRSRVQIFKRGENVASVFMWSRTTPDPSRPSVSEAVRRAAMRSAHKRAVAATAEANTHALLPLDARSQSVQSAKSILSSGLSDHDFALESGFVVVDTPSSGASSGTLLPKRPDSRASGNLAPSTSASPSVTAAIAKSRVRRYCAPVPGSILSVDQQMKLELELPTASQAGKWVRRYLMSENGTSSLAIREALSHRVGPLVIAIQDDYGYVFGGFLPSGLYIPPKESDVNFIEGPNGDGESFVYTFGHMNDPKLKIYRWTGKNRLFRLLSATRGFGMGGGGDGFAFFLDETLNNGTSSRSETYDNDCLTAKPYFSCVNLEVLTIDSNLKRVNSSSARR